MRGRVYFNNGRKSLPCLIRDVAYEGARIILTDPADIPNEIDAELATAYVMLADPLSSYVSGATIAVTGGKPIL